MSAILEKISSNFQPIGSMAKNEDTCIPVKLLATNSKFLVP